jgi:hypothetical protein
MQSVAALLHVDSDETLGSLKSGDFLTISELLTFQEKLYWPTGELVQIKLDIEYLLK